MFRSFTLIWSTQHTLGTLIYVTLLNGQKMNRGNVRFFDVARTYVPDVIRHNYVKHVATSHGESQATIIWYLQFFTFSSI